MIQTKALCWCCRLGEHTLPAPGEPTVLKHTVIPLAPCLPKVAWGLLFSHLGETCRRNFCPTLTLLLMPTCKCVYSLIKKKPSLIISASVETQMRGKNWKLKVSDQRNCRLNASTGHFLSDKFRRNQTSAWFRYSPAKDIDLQLLWFQNPWLF